MQKNTVGQEPQKFTIFHNEEPVIVTESEQKQIDFLTKILVEMKLDYVTGIEDANNRILHFTASLNAVTVNANVVTFTDTSASVTLPFTCSTILISQIK